MAFRTTSLFCVPHHGLEGLGPQTPALTAVKTDAENTHAAGSSPGISENRLKLKLPHRASHALAAPVAGDVEGGHGPVLRIKFQESMFEQPPRSSEDIARVLEILARRDLSPGERSAVLQHVYGLLAQHPIHLSPRHIAAIGRHTVEAMLPAGASLNHANRLPARQQAALLAKLAEYCVSPHKHMQFPDRRYIAIRAESLLTGPLPLRTKIELGGRLAQAHNRAARSGGKELFTDESMPGFMRRCSDIVTLLPPRGTSAAHFAECYLRALHMRLFYANNVPANTSFARTCRSLLGDQKIPDAQRRQISGMLHGLIDARLFPLEDREAATIGATL